MGQGRLASGEAKLLAAFRRLLQAVQRQVVAYVEALDAGDSGQVRAFSHGERCLHSLSGLRLTAERLGPACKATARN